MEIYTNAPKNTYVTGIKAFFLMPTDSGGIPAVAVTKSASVLISSGYTILMILIFSIGWNLILAIIMAFWPTRGDPNRRSALVALWNSGESMNATKLMVSYCMRVILYIWGKPKEASSDLEGKRAQSYPAITGPALKTDLNDITLTNESAPLIQEEQNGPRKGYFDYNPKCGLSNLLWGLLFAFIAMAMTVGNVAAGILVPVQLSMGNVAPVAKDAIFYPDVLLYSRTDDNGAGASKISALKVSPALRALGATEDSTLPVRKRVSLDSRTAGGSVRLNYAYNVTGMDMGLLSDPNLNLEVKGSCRTDDTLLLSSTDEGDTYRLFGNYTFEVKYQPQVDIPPMVNFWIDTNIQGSNVSYAIIAKTAGLYSFTSGQDPWYSTEKSNGSIAYQVRRGRPVLSCWEAKTWHLNGKTVDGTKLYTLPGLKLHKLWANKVFPFEFSVPRVISVGWVVGSAALKSASYAQGPSFILDAGESSILQDLERLVLASWVSSKNVLRDTTTYKPGNLANIAEGPGGSVEAGVAQFVLQSGDVDTLSVRILIAIPAILLFLFIVKITLSYALRSLEFEKDPIIPGEKENKIALLATQLYRGLDERISARDWKHTRSLIPFVYPTVLRNQLPKTDRDEKLGGTVTLRPTKADDK